MLSNLYLNGLDHQMSTDGFEMVRYADDFVELCRSQAEAERALSRLVHGLRRGFDFTSDEDEDRWQSREKFLFSGVLFSRGPDLSPT